MPASGSAQAYPRQRKRPSIGGHLPFRVPRSVTFGPRLGPRPPTLGRRANRHLVDVAILATLDPERLAGRGPRILRQSGIDPREVVEDRNRADGLIDDVAAVAHVELLGERAHVAGIALGV